MSQKDSGLVDAYFEASSDQVPLHTYQAEGGQTLVLFDGGEEGGILLSGRGVRAIPAFGPALRLTLRSVAQLMTSQTAARDPGFVSKLGRHVGGLCNLAIEQLEQLLGPLDRDRALVYQSADGCFTCGASGKPPVTLSWPPKLSTSVNELIAAGVVGADLVELLNRAARADADIIEVFENPGTAALRFGVKLSEKSAADLNLLAPSRLGEIENPVDREICSFLHAVAKDGGYWTVWLDRPHEVAKVLGVQLSDDAIERINNRGATETFGPVALIPIGIVVVGGAVAVVGVAAIAYAHYAEHKVAPTVVDESGLEKF